MTDSLPVMSYAISRRRLRTATAIGAVSLGLFALSACEKPTPLATATVNGDTISTDATCYSDGKTIPRAEAQKCVAEKPKKSVKLGPGDKLRLGVEPDVAKTGWLVFIDGRPALPSPIKETYYSFPGDSFFQQQSQTGQTQTKKSVRVSIVEADGSQFKGVWQLKLDNSDSAS